MNVKKAYKIAVPEKDCDPTYPRDEITRQEIHELIKPHAQKLGWHEYHDVLMDKQFIFFYPNGSMSWTASRDYFDTHSFQEISWQSILKITPEDVQSVPDTKQIVKSKNDNTLHNSNKQALLEAFTAGWDAAHNNRFSIGVNFDKWYHEKAETIKNLRGKYKNYLNPTTSDRNEKAWFTVQINGEWFKNSIDVYCEKDIELAKEMLKIVSDNFIKQAGNK